MECNQSIAELNDQMKNRCSSNDVPGAKHNSNVRCLSWTKMLLYFHRFNELFLARNTFKKKKILFCFSGILMTESHSVHVHSPTTTNTRVALSKKKNNNNFVFILQHTFVVCCGLNLQFMRNDSKIFISLLLSYPQRVHDQIWAAAPLLHNKHQ